MRGAVERGAELLAGTHDADASGGLFFPPAVLAGMAEDDPIVTEERAVRRGKGLLDQHRPRARAQRGGVLHVGEDGLLGRLSRALILTKLDVHSRTNQRATLRVAAHSRV